ncbi:ribbon-helix-helix protein, CopG family [Polymorphobacter sp. PAMC 29334]|uniref:ribbon-helix-helix protein, CopG family n=1 Tax=Polymorphobacter sp. PAMC 29334 TaxID=2862331 RepID=UPI001C75D6BC|nr:ribbon-helix-helix protein, CopG family [Polymorphobacter sp. PAMC 29334]QYE34354.1 ribbon-helix-helix protein, CopG family [Polymorphobacter sp. PAMC 29334]
MRTLVDIPDDDIAWLDRTAIADGKSRAALVREAVATLRANAAKSGLDAAFGLWSNREESEDSVVWQRRIRAEWTRPWDKDYDEVRAEYPDLFTETEDRERLSYK